MPVFRTVDEAFKPKSVKPSMVGLVTDEGEMVAARNNPSRVRTILGRVVIAVAVVALVCGLVYVAARV